MEEILNLIGVGASVASGGLFGMLGALGGAVAKHFAAKEQHKREIELRDWDMRMFAQQQTAKREETEDEIKLADSEGSWSGLNASIQHDTALSANTHKWVNDIKSLFRPFLTVALVVVVYLIWRDILSGLRDEESTLTELMTKDALSEIMAYIVYSMVFASVTSIVWWFGDRALAPPGAKNK